MRDNLFWQRQPRGHEESRPVDRVELDDIFAHDMVVGWPAAGDFAWVPSASEVVCQRIQPHVHTVVVVACNQIICKHVSVSTLARSSLSLQQYLAHQSPNGFFRAVV